MTSTPLTSTPVSSKLGNFIWYELLTSDVDKAARFYGAVVGWKSEPSQMPGMDYRPWVIDGQMVGGLMAIPAQGAAEGMRPVWLGYVSVENVDRTIGDVLATGGTLVMPATDIPGVGRIAMIADPQGAALYVMTPNSTATSQVYAPGKPGHGGWHELHSSNWEAGLTFYGKLFGWGRSDALDMGPMGTYLLFNAGGEAIGGMMNNPHAPRPFWLYYFNVDDIMAAKHRVEAAGGTIVRDPHEVPGGSWILQAQDDQGAMFALIGPHKG